MLYRYNEFVKEGLLSKGLELLNYFEIKENDKIAKKYIDMIYADWEKNKNLMAIFINLHDGYDTLTYKISDEPYTQANTSGGDYSSTVISFTSTHEIELDDVFMVNKTKAQMKGEFNPIGDETAGSARTRLLFGKNRKNNKTISKENGIEDDENVDKYINISQNQVDKLISFFKNQFISKYPQMKGQKNFNYIRILDLDKELGRKLDDFHKDKRKKNEEDYHKEQETGSKIIEETALYDREYITDYFSDLIDMVKEKYPTAIFIKIGYVDGDKITMQDKWVKTGTLSYNTMKNNPKYENGTIYEVSFTLYEDKTSNLTGNEEATKFKKLDLDIKNFLESNYGLKKGSKNSVFKLLSTGTVDPFREKGIASLYARQVVAGFGWDNYYIVLGEVS